MMLSLRRRALPAAAFALTLAAAAPAAFAVATVGETAPAFTAVDTRGKPVNLADFRGRHVVLEWVNPGCPYVVKHYGSGNMQATQKAAVDRGVVWLTVNSTHPSHGDHRSAESMTSWMQQHRAAPSATLLDPEGKVGRAYGARTTPHMYVIDPAGKLVYAGAIDNRPTANPADIAGATNHVNAALAEALAGKPVTQAQTRAYGCSVKYATAAG